MVLYILSDLDDNLILSSYKQNKQIENVKRNAKQVDSKVIFDKFGKMRITTYTTKHFKLVVQYD